MLREDTQPVEQRILTVDAVNVGVGFIANNLCDGFHAGGSCCCYPVLAELAAAVSLSRG